MSQIADGAGIGRATLYKYFPDVEAILIAWHERHVASHMDHLVSLRDQSGDAAARLGAVLEAYALICYEIAHQRPGADLTALVHRGEHIVSAQQRLHRLFGGLIAEGARGGLVRSDVTPDELAAYCLNALGAASSMPSKAAVQRLLMVTAAGLRP